MMRTLAIAAAVFAAGAALAQPSPAPFAAGDASRGEPIVRDQCPACHVARFGDADRIYTRADRRVKTPGALLAQVQMCNTQLNAGFFPDDEENIAAYLNRRYYKFGP